MAIPITIPRLGWNMEEGVFGGWLKADRDPVRPGEAIFALESEKATEEIECMDAGFLRIPADGPAVGDKLAVGTVIGFVVAAVDEPIATAPAKAAPPAEPVASPSVRRLAREQGIDLAEVRGSGPGGRISAHDLRQQPRSSPRARRAARELGIDWSQVPGSGKNGRVRECDVRAAAGPPRPPEQEIPLTTVRRRIAARMLESQRETAPVTLTTTVDATNLVNLREQFKAAGPPVPSYTDFLVKLVAVALAKHPAVAGQWTDGGIHIPATFNIGIAVDTEAGLLVPVVRNASSLGIRQVAAASCELIERARAGGLAASDMKGGCFTITNLGAFEIDAFTPIINYPECAVLGVGRIAKRPAVVGEAVVPREQVTLSLTFDHRILDGAPAARFLQTLAAAVESPAPFVVT